MKHLFLGLITAAVLAFAACNGNTGKNAEGTGHEAGHSATGSAGNASNEQGDFAELFAHYQHLTFALSSDNDKEAANAAQGMLEALSKIESAGFNADDKATYDDIAADIKENAEHIAGNVGNIAHQREHLVVLSKDFYDITKTFGAGKPLYKVFCPMYSNNNGAYWLSDTKEVKNPYYGSEMLTCGEVQEELM
ncbi:DUF3347 domain-containing protein [Parapedobacter lycopersici]|uniref:DUF3347 domain-containing protein n=1 Tax=Parapedobacter lycopersici TaxID=1864939 RepID=UPI00214D34F4|nr:DUF3347 domain-containing protein [Parapedobacter lycopersici]